MNAEQRLLFGARKISLLVMRQLAVFLKWLSNHQTKSLLFFKYYHVFNRIVNFNHMVIFLGNFL